MKLKDQVAIITGAGRNIGEESPKLFAAEGARRSRWSTSTGRAAKRTVDAVQGRRRRRRGSTSPMSPRAPTSSAMVKAVVGRLRAAWTSW